jgi:hypothetical protein
MPGLLPSLTAYIFCSPTRFLFVPAVGVDAAGEARTDSEAEAFVPFVRTVGCAMVVQR